MNKDKLLLARVSDKVNQYFKSGISTCTSFLDPAEQFEAQGILNNVPYAMHGGYDGAERKMIIIGESEVSTNELPSWMRVLKITSNETLNHRSILGSILGLGITREKTGDIIIDGSVANVIVQKEISDFILNNLNYVGREKVKVSEIPFENIFKIEKTIKEINLTVASLRLDAIISGALGLSREKSGAIIESERVNVNYKLSTSVKKQIKVGDLISIRGYGRIEIADVLGESRSGRIKIRINKL